MRIFLTNAPWEKESRYGVRAGSRWPFTLKFDEGKKRHYLPFPFFLAYSTSLLKKNNKEAVLVDAIAEGMDYRDFQEKIKSYNPDLLVFEIAATSFSNDIKIIQEAKNNLKQAKVAVCGTHASVSFKDILESYEFIDYVLIGEFEYTILDLVNCLEKQNDLDSVSGLVYRKNSNIAINKPRITIKELDKLPYPERETLPIYSYNDGFCNLPAPNVQVLASRGCPNSCTFCLWPQAFYKERLYRRRNAKLVVDEIEYLLNKYDFKAVYFDDDVFNIDRCFVADICKQIKKRSINIPWAAMAKADLMDEELLKSMKDAGLYAIKYGIESADRGILKLCKKNIDLEKTKEVIRFTKNLGIKIHLTFCLGLPGENKDTIAKTFSFIDQTKPDSLQVSFATPLPGTEYYNYVKEKGHLVSCDFSDYDGNYKCVVKTNELSNYDLERVKNNLIPI